MKTIKEIEERIDKIFEVHKGKVELACDEYHGHTVLRNCFRADDPNELITVVKSFGGISGRAKLR